MALAQTKQKNPNYDRIFLSLMTFGQGHFRPLDAEKAKKQI